LADRKLWSANDEKRKNVIIGIVTTPASDKDREITGKNLSDYILEINHHFNYWSGSKPIAIPYNISEKDLNTLLPQINGVHLTGGMLDLVNDKGELHPYYLTVKKIIAYSIMMKDEKK